MSWQYVKLIEAGEMAELKRDYKLAIQKFEQCFEKGVTQSGSITKKMLRERIYELKQKTE